MQLLIDSVEDLDALSFLELGLGPVWVGIGSLPPFSPSVLNVPQSFISRVQLLKAKSAVLSKRLPSVKIDSCFSLLDGAEISSDISVLCKKCQTRLTATKNEIAQTVNGLSDLNSSFNEITERLQSLDRRRKRFSETKKAMSEINLACLLKLRNVVKIVRSFGQIEREEKKDDEKREESDGNWLERAVKTGRRLKERLIAELQRIRERIPEIKAALKDVKVDEDETKEQKKKAAELADLQEQREILNLQLKEREFHHKMKTKQLEDDLAALTEEVAKARLLRKQAQSAENQMKVFLTEAERKRDVTELKISQVRYLLALSEISGLQSDSLLYESKSSLEISELEEELGRLLRQKEILQQNISKEDVKASEPKLSLAKIPPEDVSSLSQPLGTGAYGDVRIGRWQGSSVVVRGLDHHFVVHEEEIPSIFHPNIESLLGVILKEGNVVHGLVTRLFEGSLLDVINASTQSSPLTVREKIDLAMGFVSGVSYLHQLPTPFLHGDIRSTNILITEDMEAKIGNLAFARYVNEHAERLDRGHAYIAPEIKGKMQSPEADVYSLGVTLAELITGDDPAGKEIQDLVGSGIFLESVRTICFQMTSRNPAERPQAQACLDSLQATCQSADYQRCPPKRAVKGKSHGRVVKNLESTKKEIC